jgi:hypothetical protein
MSTSTDAKSAKATSVNEQKQQEANDHNAVGVLTMGPVSATLRARPIYSTLLD